MIGALITHYPTPIVHFLAVLPSCRLAVLPSRIA